MSLLGLDLNATRIGGVRGPLGDYPCIEPIDPPRAELPLVLSLGGRMPVLGTAGLRWCRRSPHLVWQNFLPQLGEMAQGPRNGNPAGLEATKALGFVFHHILGSCRGADGVVLALPAYLSGPQVELVMTLALQTGLPLLGSVCAPLAAALAAHAEQAWFGTVVLVDVDDHALTLATVGSDQEHAQLLDLRCLSQLNQRMWQERLLNALADCCIMDSRWDPRESPDGEQSLFDQLDDVMDAVQQGRIIKLTVQAPGRFQNLVLQPRDPVAFCANLRQQVVNEIQQIFNAPWPEGRPSTILVTAAAARLPGLVDTLQSAAEQWTPAVLPKKKKTASALEDFGSGLLDDEAGDGRAVVVLADGATARGAHSVAGYFHRGDIASGHLHAAAPLPLPQPLEAGPARLHFQGRDFLLGTRTFALGRQTSADLVFDAEHWPRVSGRHCEIVYDHRMHMLCNRSREGTFVNDRPATQAMPLRAGDWIRLGPDGPTLRFLGQAVEMRTTA
ncbi:MAG TPA: FHA domain-containing protein [Gemmataceae bacterium]|nr:FHA domain-containing protein [Gemmataceae bacterium]